MREGAKLGVFSSCNSLTYAIDNVSTPAKNQTKPNPNGTNMFLSETHEKLCRSIAKESESVVVSVG